MSSTPRATPALNAAPATRPIPMVDLRKQYDRIADEIDAAVLDVIRSTAFIKGPVVEAFERELADYLGTRHVVACANGTDALQIAMMALELSPGDEVIVPSFTYVATAEVIALLGLTPVMVDVDPDTFNLTAELVAPAITPRTRAIVPVHLFGQSCDMAPLLVLAKAHHLYVIEDNAQAIGATYTFPDGRTAKTGTMGHVGCTSFFPSKNLGCYGDGGALCTDDPAIAARLTQIANHGQSRQYYHDVVGVNSRLDAMQAAILRVKLPHLDAYNAARRQAADAYDAAFAKTAGLITPVRAPYSTHVFHQYTLRVTDGSREALREHLREHAIAHNVYYPVPLWEQGAFAKTVPAGFELPITRRLCGEVLSLPMHTELSEGDIAQVTEVVLAGLQ